MNRLNIVGLISISILVMILHGCVADDLSDCGISIQFSYKKNVEGIDKFSTDVQRITLFVFDSNGLYVGEFSDEGDVLKSSNYRMNVGLKSGSYKLVAWGNLCDDYELPTFTKETNIEDVRLSLRSQDNIVNEHPTHLFYGETDVEFDSETIGRKYVELDMMKNTNTIIVRTKELPINSEYSDKRMRKSETPEYECLITSKNKTYKFDNSIIGDDRLTYIPASSASVEEQTLKSDFVIMRELNDGTTESRIIIRDFSTKSSEPKELLNESLIPFLIPASVTGDLDIDSDFELDVVLQYGNGTVTIIINGYVVVEDEWVVG